MSQFKFHRFALGSILAVLALPLLRMAFPLALPFLAGSLLALAAEKPVRFFQNKLSMGRGGASFLGVSLTLALLLGLGLLLFSAAFRGLRNLASIAPDLEAAARQGLTALQDWLLTLAMAAPEGLRSLLTKTILGIFDGGSTLYAQAAASLPGMAAGLLSHITGGFLGIGTGILSAYLISTRLPRIKAWCQRRLPERWTRQYRPALKELRSALGGWLKAQAGLLVLTGCILLTGFLLLRVRHAPVWAVLIALVDAVPMLGTGMVLIPWSIISFLQQDPTRGFGLLGIFAAATLARSSLEPRLLGKELGLDPLVTLVALYLGYQLLGLPGLIAAPLLTVAGVQLLKATPEER